MENSGSAIGFSSFFRLTSAGNPSYERGPEWIRWDVSPTVAKHLRVECVAK